jgi:hypothetical protein
MVLSLRPRQRQAVVEMLNLTQKSPMVLSAVNDADEANTYKVRARCRVFVATEARINS